MKSTIREDGSVILPKEMLAAIGVDVGDLVDLYVREYGITIVKAGSKRGEWDEFFDTVPIVDFPDREGS